MSIVGSISQGSWRNAYGFTLEVATIFDFSALEASNHPHASQYRDRGVGTIHWFHQATDRELGVSPSANAA